MNKRVFIFKKPLLKVVVQEMELRFVSKPETQFVAIGSTATITCELSKADEEVTWFANGHPIGKRFVFVRVVFWQNKFICIMRGRTMV